MEIARYELAAIETAIQEVAHNDIQELSELQLALVGGGIADVVVA